MHCESNQEDNVWILFLDPLDNYVLNKKEKLEENLQYEEIFTNFPNVETLKTFMWLINKRIMSVPPKILSLTTQGVYNISQR